MSNDVLRIDLGDYFVKSLNITSSIKDYYDYGGCFSSISYTYDTSAEISLQGVYGWECLNKFSINIPKFDIPNSFNEEITSMIVHGDLKCKLILEISKSELKEEYSKKYKINQ